MKPYNYWSSGVWTEHSTEGQNPVVQLCLDLLQDLQLTQKSLSKAATEHKVSCREIESIILNIKKKLLSPRSLMFQHKHVQHNHSTSSLTLTYPMNIPHVLILQATNIKCKYFKSFYHLYNLHLTIYHSQWSYTMWIPMKGIEFFAIDIILFLGENLGSAQGRPNMWGHSWAFRERLWGSRDGDGDDDGWVYVKLLFLTKVLSVALFKTFCMVSRCFLIVRLLSAIWQMIVKLVTTKYELAQLLPPSLSCPYMASGCLCSGFCKIFLILCRT